MNVGVLEFVLLENPILQKTKEGHSMLATRRIEKARRIRDPPYKIRIEKSTKATRNINEVKLPNLLTFIED